MFFVYQGTERLLRQLHIRCCYYSQINKEAGLIVDPWIKESGLANLCRRCLCREAISMLWIFRERKLWWKFSVHTEEGFAGPLSLGWINAEDCHFPVSLRLWCLTWLCPHQQTPSCRTSVTQDFFRYSHPTSARRVRNEYSAQTLAREKQRHIFQEKALRL